MLHKQYVTPFAPMNTLARLLEHEQYAQWISMDNILDVILPPSAPARAARCRHPGCRLPSVPYARRDPRPARSAEGGGPPAFVYSLPQDVHVAAMTREGAAPVDGASYGTLLCALRLPRPPARRVLRRVHRRSEVTRAVRPEPHRGDRRSRRLARRAGTNGTRVTRSFRRSSRCRSSSICRRRGRVSGPTRRRRRLRPTSRPRCMRCSATIRGRRRRSSAVRCSERRALPPPPRSTDPQVVASSYGSVYGALLDDARRLYIFDGIALREYAYELDGTGSGRMTAITDEDRARGQRAIRETVEGVARLNRYRQ